MPQAPRDRDQHSQAQPDVAVADGAAGEEEWAQSDDRVIGRALRWSAVALVVLGATVGGALYWATRTPPPPPAKVTQLVQPVVPERPRDVIPAVRFTDITKQAGIDFVHTNGATGGKLLPETMGGGVAFFDANGDGHPDLLFVDSTSWPGQPRNKARPGSLVLYLNDGTGHFTNATAGSGLEVDFYGMGVAVGDYDNDGRVDVFATGVGGYHLFHNLGGGKFQEVTARAGVAGAPDDWGTGAAFVDYDNDGRLDLFVCNYVRWSRDIDREVGYSLTGIGRAYGPPTNFQGAFCRLYRNRGDGTFEDVSERAGVRVVNSNALGVPAGKSLAVAPVDLDGDGWIDLVVANDTVQNFVFHNRRDGTFEEIGARSGIAFDGYGNTRGAMGIDAARLHNDAALGIAIGNFANEMTALYVSQQCDPLLFTDDAITEGVGPASRLLLKFGMFFFDYDLDGWVDLLSADGHLEEEINKVQQSQHYAQPAQLFRNLGATGGGFAAVPPDKAGADLFKPMVGRGSAFADIDGDGDVDVVITQVGGPPLLLRNDQDLHHDWVRLKFVGTTCNRDAIGATVRLRTAATGTQWRQVMPTRSYLSQSELPVTFGLGPHAQPPTVEITWPDGTTQTVKDVLLNRTTTVTQPGGRAG